MTCFTFENTLIKLFITFCELGLANVVVIKTTFLLVTDKAFNIAPVCKYKLSQLMSFPLASGPCKRNVS